MEVSSRSRWVVMALVAGAFALGLLAAEVCRAQEITDLAQTTPREIPASPAPTLTEAEQITRLQRTIAADEKRVDELRCEIADPTSEYYQAETEFRALDDRLTEEKTELAKATEADDAAAVARLKAALADTEKKRQLARERFDLAIQTRKTLQEQIAVLEKKIQQDKQALDKLTGDAPPEPPTPSTPTPSETKPASPPAAEATAPVATTPAATTVPQPVPATPEPVSLAKLVKQELQAPSQELIEAKQSVDVKKQAAEAAEQEVKSVTERLAALEKSVVIEQKLLAAAKKKAELANETRLAAELEYQEKSAQGLMGNELAEIAARRADSERLFQEAESEVRARLDRLQELQSERVDLQREQLAALQEAKRRQDEALAATAKLGQLNNPFSLHNIIQWLLNKGPTLAMILAVMYGLYKGMQITTRRVVELVVQSSSRSPPEENEARINTLVGVFQNAATMTIIIGGGIMFCEEAGIAVAPLMGGAAVLGLAVAFGAQNLIRDYFYGFVILLENQYKINDVLRIGDVSGQVERITLRMTVLRDLEGCVHFIPNGKIDCVSNMTHGWSRAVFDIGVSHKEDVDQVIDTLMSLAMEMRQEPAFSRLIIDDPEMLGVDKVDASGVTIKFLIKTRPLRQWMIKRELLRRIKRRFRELGIESAMSRHFVLSEPPAKESLPEPDESSLPRRAA